MSPLTFAVTLADWTDKQDMLRMMLNCLKSQTCHDFDVILADHHYDARRSVVAELSEHCSFNVWHTPVNPAPHVARRYMDCSVFNVGWVMSEAKRCVRYSEWRFLSPDFVATLLSEPADLFIDFDFHCLHDEAPWDRTTGDIMWDRVPDFGSKTKNYPITPSNCYGNVALSREKWLDVNGFNEVSFNFYHWEDIDYSARCSNSGYAAKRIVQKMVRMHHDYGQYPNRANRKVEREFKPICSACSDLISYASSNVGVDDDSIGIVSESQWSSLFDARYPQVKRVDQGRKSWHVCQKCNFIFPCVTPDGNLDYVFGDPEYKTSPIDVSGSGRNLRNLSDDLKGLSWPDKIELYKNSWENPRYLEQL